jgi:hypothetical protein
MTIYYNSLIGQIELGAPINLPMGDNVSLQFGGATVLLLSLKPDVQLEVISLSGGCLIKHPLTLQDIETSQEFRNWTNCLQIYFGQQENAVETLALELNDLFRSLWVYL